MERQHDNILAADHRLFVSQRNVKREQASIRNHLLSIVRDANVVLLVKKSVFPDIPLVANERNGVWYCPLGTPSCYFKSTDGHPSQWDFSLSRMNLDFARQAMQKGAVLVDSTRRGKRFPDSLSVTVPIWIAVINSIVFEKVCNFDAPPWVSKSHVEQISSLIPLWIESVSESVKTMIRQLLSDHLVHPFQPVWVCSTEDQSLEWFGTGAESLLEEGNESTSLSFTPLILLSASAVTSDGMHSQHHSWQYIQGAGDDEEAWAHGLSPSQFWKHKELILASDDYREVETAVEHIVNQKSKNFAVSTVATDDTDLPIPLCHIGQSGISIIHSCSSVNDAINEVCRHTGKMTLSGVIEIIPRCGNAINRVCPSPPGHDDSAIPLLQIHATVKQPRSHFSMVSIPAVISFYAQLLNDKKSDDTVSLSIVDHDDGTLAYTVAMTILLGFFHATSLDFLPCENSKKEEKISKDGILSVLTALQIHIPQIRIPRALMKELNAYFVAPSSIISER